MYFYMLLFALALLLLVLVAGKTVNNAKRWIYITETLSFQPSEVVKILMIVFYAGFLSKNRDELGSFTKGWIKNLIPLGIIIAFLVVEPHLSASIVIIGVTVVMMVIAGCKLWQILVPRSSCCSICRNCNSEYSKICACNKENNNLLRPMERCNR